MVTATPIAPDPTAEILRKLESLQRDLHALVEKQREQDELIAELVPIAKHALRIGAEKLERFETRGYFAFGAELVKVADRVVTGFSPQEVEELGDNVVAILQTLKNVTQPAMRTLADETAAAVEAAGVKPLDWRGILRATRKPEVQRGLARVFTILERIGRAGDGEKPGKKRLHQLLAPRAAPQRAPQRRAEPVEPAKQPVTEPPEKPVAKTVDGVAMDREGFLIDAAAWTPEIGRTIAASIGLQLGDAQWKVIEAARSDYSAAGKSPNVRRLSQAASVTVKELYALFPGAPAKNVARVAGLPKPVGCI